MKKGGSTRQCDPGPGSRRRRVRSSGIPGAAAGRRRALLVGAPDTGLDLGAMLARMGCVLERWRGGDSIASVAARYALVILAGVLAPDDVRMICAEARAADPTPVVVALVDSGVAAGVLAAEPDEVFVSDPPHVIEWRLRRLLEASFLELVAERQALLVDGKEEHLTPTEFKIMELLFENRGAVVSDEDLLRHGWGDKTTSIRTLYAYISHLHDKMGRHSQRLRREPSVGYRLIV